METLGMAEISHRCATEVTELNMAEALHDALNRVIDCTRLRIGITPQRGAESHTGVVDLHSTAKGYVAMMIRFREMRALALMRYHLDHVKPASNLVVIFIVMFTPSLTPRGLPMTYRSVTFVILHRRDR